MPRCSIGVVGDIQRRQHRLGAGRGAPERDEQADDEADAQRVVGLADEFVDPVVDQRVGRRRQQPRAPPQAAVPRRNVESQAVDRDQHADRREQRRAWRRTRTRRRRARPDPWWPPAGRAEDHAAPTPPVAASSGGSGGVAAVQLAVLASVRLAVMPSGRENAATAASRCGAATSFLRIDRDFLLRQGGRGLMWPPYAATHVPLALVVTQRRQAFWQSFGRWFVRPFRQLTSVALIRRASSQKEARCDDPENRPIPCCSSSRQRRAWCSTWTAWKTTSARCSASLPLARIYYAVKANPARPVLERLVRLGSSFDAASFEEVAGCLDAGARPDAISFGNTIKKVSAIRRAHAARRDAVRLRFGRGAGEAGAATRRARGSIAASWWRTRAPTGRCRASSAPRSRTRAS